MTNKCYVTTIVNTQQPNKMGDLWATEPTNFINISQAF